MSAQRICETNNFNSKMPAISGKINFWFKWQKQQHVPFYLVMLLRVRALSFVNLEITFNTLPRHQSFRYCESIKEKQKNLEEVKKIISNTDISDVDVSKNIESEPKEENNNNKSIFGSIDSFFGYGINQVSSTIDFTSKTLNSSIRSGGDFTSSVIKDTTQVLQSISPQIFSEDTKIIPDKVEQAFNYSTSQSKAATTFVKSSIGTITDLGLSIGSSAAKFIPTFEKKSETETSQTVVALGNLLRTTASAVKDTMESTDHITSTLTEEGIAATESLSSHILGKQSGTMLGSSLRAGKDVFDTVNSTRKLNLQKLSIKITKKARDGALSELSLKNKDPIQIDSTSKPPTFSTEVVEEIKLPKE